MSDRPYQWRCVAGLLKPSPSSYEMRGERDEAARRHILLWGCTRVQIRDPGSDWKPYKP